MAMAASMVVMSAGTVSWGVAAAVVTHQRAGVAADLSAVAAAQWLADGDGDLGRPAGRLRRPDGDPCRVAHEVSAANGARLESCRVEGSDVVVTVAVDLPAPLAVLAGDSVRAVVVSSRAGPRG